MGVKAKGSKSGYTTGVCGHGIGYDGEKIRRTSHVKANSIGYNSFCWNGSQQKVLRSRNNVNPNNRQPKYYSPNQDS